MNFGDALFNLKDGHRVSREGWNGNGMWLTLSCDGGVRVPADALWSKHNREFAEQNGGSVIILPYITMKTADNCIVPWLASQTDILAEDWCVVVD